MRRAVAAAALRRAGRTPGTTSLAPGGDFNSLDGGGWQLAAGGADIIQEADPDGSSTRVLALPSGAVAVSPTMCVDLDYPTARAWVRNAVGGGDVDISVVYDAGKTANVPKEVGHLHGTKKASWGLSPDVKIQPQLAGKEAGWRRVAFVLSARRQEQRVPRRQLLRRPSNGPLAGPMGRPTCVGRPPSGPPP